MRPSMFVARCLVQFSKEATLAWHRSKGSFIRSVPSWEQLIVKEIHDLPADQIRVFCLLKKVRYVFRLHYPRSGSMLTTKLEKGPLKGFVATVSAIDTASHTTEIIEKVEYTLYARFLLRKYRENRFNKRLSRFYQYKHEVIVNDLALKLHLGKQKRLKILVTGATGLIGSSLVTFLNSFDQDVYSLRRQKEEIVSDRDILFDGKTGDVNRSELEGFDAIIHLAGSSIQGRWTKRKKQAIFKSRVEMTKQLCQVLASLEKPPKVFLSASAIGYYGDQGDNPLTEETQPASETFLSTICKEWEEATSCLKGKNVRLGHLRFGMVLSSSSGALKKMLTPFRLGLGGKIGTGDQYMSWIAIDDVINAIYHVILTDSLHGGINLVSPNPIRNKDFTFLLARYLKRSHGPRLPTFLVKLFFGQMGKELLLSSAKVEPTKLLSSGYNFLYPTLERAFPHLIF